VRLVGLNQYDEPGEHPRLEVRRLEWEFSQNKHVACFNSRFLSMPLTWANGIFLVVQHSTVGTTLGTEPEPHNIMSPVHRGNSAHLILLPCGRSEVSLRRSWHQTLITGLPFLIIKMTISSSETSVLPLLLIRSRKFICVIYLYVSWTSKMPCTKWVLS
jgi:hypothetical protein